MGFVTLGIFALNMQGLEGGLLQMLNHGIVTGALFLCVGVAYERTHSRMIKDYGGAAHVWPYYAGAFMLFTLAAIGLPGLNGFVGEFLVILGGFAFRPWAGVLAATGIILGAAYMLWLYQRVFFMQLNPALKGHPDLNAKELLSLLPLAALVLWIGVYPNAFLSFMHPTVQGLLQRVQPGTEYTLTTAELLRDIITAIL
jgi:NADH-quinone oxidoreductase subunit M